MDTVTSYFGELLIGLSIAEKGEGGAARSKLPAAGGQVAGGLFDLRPGLCIYE
jgi:hypothetical protein